MPYPHGSIPLDPSGYTIAYIAQLVRRQDPLTAGDWTSSSLQWFDRSHDTVVIRDILPVSHLQSDSQRPDLIHPKPLPILPVQDLIPPTRLLPTPPRVVPPRKRRRVVLSPSLRIRKSHELGHPDVTGMSDVHVPREDGTIESVVYDFRGDCFELVPSAEHP